MVKTDKHKQGLIGRWYKKRSKQRGKITEGVNGKKDIQE